MKTLALCVMVPLLQAAVVAQPVLDTNDFIMVLKSTPAGELPAAAALLVRQARPEQRLATTTQVVKQAIRLRPAAALAIVAEVSREHPSLAPLVAETAVQEQSALVEEITRIAAAVSPSHAPEMVQRVGLLDPARLRTVVLIASRAAPAQNRGILRAAGVVRPELKPYLEVEMAHYGRSFPPVARSFDRAVQLQLSANLDANGPPAGPRSQRPTSPPTTTPPRVGAAPPGGRNYAKP